MDIKKFGILSSSADPEKVGKMIEGFIIGLSVLIIYFAHTMGLNVVNEQITALAVQFGAAISAVLVVFGAIRKIVIAIQQRFGGSKSPVV